MPTVTATFETRRDAELAVEHLVQQHDLERDDIVVGAEGNENTAGSETGGADADTPFEDGDEDDAALNGDMLVTVTVEDEDLAETVMEVLEEFGGGDANVDA